MVSFTVVGLCGNDESRRNMNTLFTLSIKSKEKCKSANINARTLNGYSIIESKSYDFKWLSYSNKIMDLPLKIMKAYRQLCDCLSNIK